MYDSSGYEDEVVNKIISTIDASIAQNGDKPVTLSHLRNLLNLANQSLAKTRARDDWQGEMEGCRYEIY